ncbi:MAG: hypothetical protein ACFFBF_15060 [Promethearchaeota archaeon]
MRFIAVHLAPSIRDKYGMGFEIVTIEEGNEPLEFKIAIGLEKELRIKDFTGKEKES